MQLKADRSDFIIFAHRGASGYEPENTLLAIRKAIELGARWIEVDVYAVDGELVVFHDKRLERTTNGKGKIEKCSLSYLRSLDAGKGEKIPLLREVLDILGGEIGLNIELKGANSAGLTAELIDDYALQGRLNYRQIIVSSFNIQELQAFKRYCPRVRIGALTHKFLKDYAQFGEQLGAYSIHADIEEINQEFIDDTHRRRMKFFVYTVNDAEEMLHLREMKADGIFTNYPDLALSVLNQQSR